MSTPHSTHHAYWQTHAPTTAATMQPRYAPLSEQHTTDIAILGAGITGLTTALELLQRGFQVSVFEASIIGAGTTGGSSGHLDSHPEQGPVMLTRILGRDKAQEIIALRARAIDRIEHLSHAATQFQRLPAYSYTAKASEEHELRKEFEEASRLGLQVTWEQNIPFPQAYCGYRIDGMARINCLAYLLHLADLVTQAGGRIFEQSFSCGPDQKNPTVLSVGDHEVHCQHVVCAVHYNCSSIRRIDLLVPAYQSYVLAARVPAMPPDALFWDNADPYHYTRWAGDAENPVLMIGGCDHRTGDGDAAQAQQDLETYAREHFQIDEILSRWSAELFEPPDGLPVIGAVPGAERIWMAAGFGGVGLTWGTAAAELLADLITGCHIPLQNEIAPGRLGLKGLATIVGELLPVASSYAQHILPVGSADPYTLQPGEGQVCRVQGEFSGISCDQNHQLHRVSPICSHKGGVLQWNAAEQTWDCPVHGGRFTADGERIYGPPCKNLKQLDPEPTIVE